MWTELMDVFPEINDSRAIIEACALNPIRRRVVIFCMTARVGSTALLSLISERYNFPYIQELFNGRDIANKFKNDYAIKSFAGYLLFVNDIVPVDMVFAFKVNWSDFAWCIEADCVEILFPNASFVYLDRVDIDAQAVSLYCASRSGKWHNFKDQKFDRNVEIEFSKMEIDRTVWELLDAKMAWLRFFNSKRILPTTIFYESILSSPKGGIERLLRDFDLAGEPMSDWASGNIEKIVDPQQAQILERYRRERYQGVYL